MALSVCEAARWIGWVQRADDGEYWLRAPIAWQLAGMLVCKDFPGMSHQTVSVVCT